MSLQRAYEKWKSKADFYLVYIREAHPQDGRRPNKTIKVDQPKSHDQRAEIAGQCIKDLKLGMPVLVDDMQDSVATAYNAMPDRLFVLNADATVAYRGSRGPRGFQVEEMEAALSKLVAPK